MRIPPLRLLLVGLAALGCASSGAAPTPEAARARAPGLREAALERLARGCEQREPGACLALGYEGLWAGADRVAATGYLAACELGSGIGCAGLGALHAVGRGVARDPELALTLARRACAARVDVGCLNAALLGAAGGDAPAELEKKAGRHLLALGRGGGLRREFPAPATDPAAAEDAWSAEEARERVASRVPPTLHAALGVLSPDAIERAPARVDAVVTRVLAAMRLAAAGGCAETAGDGVAWAAFAVGPDGDAIDVRAAAAPEHEPVRRCLEARVAAWTFPPPLRPGARHLVRTATPVAGVAPEAEPEYAVAGYTPVRMKEPGCVVASLRRNSRWLDATAVPLTAKFAVEPDGTVRAFEMMTRTTEANAAAVLSAVAGCAWIPGADPSGRPASLWAILPVRL